MNKKVKTISHLGDEVSGKQPHADNVVSLSLDVANQHILLESLAEGLIIINESETIVYVNKRMEKLFGYDRKEVIGQTLNMLLPARFATKHSMQVSKHFAHPMIRSMGQGLELLAKRKDGSEFPIDVSLSFLKTEIGNLSLALVTDITKLKEAENSLIQRNEDLDAFAHTLAHELKGSVTTMSGLSRRMQEKGEAFSAGKRSDYLERIADCGQTINNIIYELLLFAETRKEEVESRRLKMGDIIDEVLCRLYNEIKQCKAKIILPESYPEVNSYGPWVREVWVNYISNALKYGGSPPLLKIGSTLEKNGFARFWVRDNGAGLTEDQQSQLFTPHKRLDQPNIKGHGLGLSIVKRIIEKLGGQVGIESEVGRGTVFSFTLPIEN